MKLLVKKSVFEELIRPKIYLSFSYGTIEKAFNSAVHPRDERGRFTDKGIMELTEQEREELLDYLEKEEYEDYNGFHISKRKIDAVKEGRYKTEIAMCNILAEKGFDVYLLEENYTKGKKADTFFKKQGKRDFLELKDTDNDLTRQYNRSIEQAKSCFISIKGAVSSSKMKSLKDAIAKNPNADEVYLYIDSDKKFLKVK